MGGVYVVSNLGNRSDCFFGGGRVVFQTLNTKPYVLASNLLKL